MRRQFTTRERIGVITESGFSAEGLKLSGSPRTMRALEELVSVLCDMVLGQREQIQRVRELHLPCTAFSVQEGGCGPGEHTVSDPPVCFHCQAAWPCPTVNALDGTA